MATINLKTIKFPDLEDVYTVENKVDRDEFESRIDEVIAIVSGGNSVFTSPTAPTTGIQENDIWFNSAQDNAIYIYNGINWENKEFGTYAIEDLSITDSKILGMNASKLSGTVSVDRLSINDIVNAGNLALQSQIPTTVASLQDSSNYATKTYADQAVEYYISESMEYDGVCLHAKEDELSTFINIIPNEYGATVKIITREESIENNELVVIDKEILSINGDLIQAETNNINLLTDYVSAKQEDYEYFEMGPLSQEGESEDNYIVVAKYIADGTESDTWLEMKCTEEELGAYSTPYVGMASPLYLNGVQLGEQEPWIEFEHNNTIRVKIHDFIAYNFQRYNPPYLEDGDVLEIKFQRENEEGFVPKTSQCFNFGHINETDAFCTSTFGIALQANRSCQHVIGLYNNSSSDALFIVGNGGGDSYKSNAMEVKYNGNTTIAGSLTQNSDKRLKEHKEYLCENTKSTEFINNLKPAYYMKDKENHLGFYAQDVEEIDNWGCMVGEMNGYKTLGYTEIIAPLVDYCQKLEQRVSELELKIKGDE